MIWIIVAALALVMAAIPALLLGMNLRAYRPTPALARGQAFSRVSVLIPARNEQRSIRAAVEAALASRGVEVEVVVQHDRSDDATAAIVRETARRDGRVLLRRGPELPEGWCGKQYTCWSLANKASHDLLLFLDADVRLRLDGVAPMVAFLEESETDLVSGIPLQETGTQLELLVIPLIHFVLLGFLPMPRMRASRHPAYAAGCGQLFLARRSSYEKAGGHAAIRATLHDGIRLPRAFREAGLRTGLCDTTDVATCRRPRHSVATRRGWWGRCASASRSWARYSTRSGCSSSLRSNGTPWCGSCWAGRAVGKGGRTPGREFRPTAERGVSWPSRRGGQGHECASLLCDPG